MLVLPSTTMVFNIPNLSIGMGYGSKKDLQAIRIVDHHQGQGGKSSGGEQHRGLIFEPVIFHLRGLTKESISRRIVDNQQSESRLGPRTRAAQVVGRGS